MQGQATAGPDGVVFVSGYGLKVYVERGHLVVHEGVGKRRQTRRYNRVTSGLKRLVIHGHSGFVSFEALRWIRDVRAVFVQIDRDGTLVALNAPPRHAQMDLRRAQALAAGSDAGLRGMSRLLKAKVEHQAQVAERLVHIKPVVRPGMALAKSQRKPIAVADAIREQLAALDGAQTMKDLRHAEMVAARFYWSVWNEVPARFDPTWSVPIHWHLAGPRHTPGWDTPRSLQASTPAHALLNYGYAVLETEAIIAAHRWGFDPSIGILHFDKRGRANFVSDLMEPVRPIVDAFVLDLIERRVFQRGDCVETRGGVCRLGPTLARELGGWAPQLSDVLDPHAAELAKTLVPGIRGRRARISEPWEQR